jgi:membrane protein implicated in regulation of membrane protease activity
MDLLAWHHLVFCIPLVVGLLLAAGAAAHHGHDLWLPRVMIGCLVFGGVGLALHAALAVGVVLSLGAASAATLALTRRSLLQRLLPSAETYLISRQEFAGCGGTLLLPADEATGYAQVKDREGNVHNVRCRSVDGPLAKGIAILIVEYDEPTQTYVVAANPLQGGTP